jgi:hypothetical protein
VTKSKATEMTPHTCPPIPEKPAVHPELTSQWLGVGVRSGNHPFTLDAYESFIGSSHGVAKVRAVYARFLIRAAWELVEAWELSREVQR